MKIEYRACTIVLLCVFVCLRVLISDDLHSLANKCSPIVSGSSLLKAWPNLSVFPLFALFILYHIFYLSGMSSVVIYFKYPSKLAKLVLLIWPSSSIFGRWINFEAVEILSLHCWSLYIEELLGQSSCFRW